MVLDFTIPVVVLKAHPLAHGAAEGTEIERLAALVPAEHAGEMHNVLRMFVALHSHQD